MQKYTIRRFKSLASTQEKAKEFANKGLSDIVVIADTQTRGKGRFKRRWHSGKGGLWMSILLKPENTDNLQYLTFAAAIAVAESIKKISRLNAAIKWPNDVHFEGRKLCGILTEGIFGRENYAIIGIGLNINQNKFPAEIRDSASSLRIIKGRKIDEKVFLKCVMGKFYLLYEEFFNKGKFECILKIWKKRCDTIGKDIKVITRKGVLYGKAFGVDSECNLLLRSKEGNIKKIAEGDIKIRLDKV